MAARNKADIHMIRQILITGAVTTGGKQRESLYALIEKLSKRYANKVYSPIDTMQFQGTDKERYERALSLVKTSDLLVAEVTIPSVGQGMEIQEACRMSKPLIVVVEENSKVSGLLLGIPNLHEVVRYTNLDDLERGLNRSLEKLSKTAGRS